MPRSRMIGNLLTGMSRSRVVLLLGLFSVVTLSIAGTNAAQQWQRGWGRRGYRGYTTPDGRPYRNGAPDWENDVTYKQDVFTFCRIRFDSYHGFGWSTDYPDSDLNFSFRLQQLTSLKVDPDGKIVTLLDPTLFDYPFIYMCEPGVIALTDDEASALRRYLLNGGFLMCDDFWGSEQWEHLEQVMKAVFPNRTPTELSIDHPVFNMVYDLDKKPQVPNVRDGVNGRGMGPGGTHVSWEHREYGSKEVHYKGCLLYTSPSPRDRTRSRMPSSA